MTFGSEPWVSAGHPTNETEPVPMTGELAAALKLPRGFMLIAEDPVLGPAVSTSLARVEKRLLDAIAHSDPFANATARHLAEAGGKRIRPLLTILASHLGDYRSPQVVQAAVVVEMTHLASLYHDDVMDSAPLRRGAPTAHQLWGNSVAILTGDLIFARASILVSELGAEALRIQGRTFERLCLGQLHETVGPGEQDPLEFYISVLADKTGSLVAASGQMGALAAGAPREFIDVMVQYGEAVGIAFQLADDVIDFIGEESGKSRGTDLREGVPTLPVLLLRRIAEAGDASAELALELVDQDLSGDEALSAAVAAVAEHPVIEQAWEYARSWSQRAVDALAVLPESTVKEALTDFAWAVVERKG